MNAVLRILCILCTVHWLTACYAEATPGQGNRDPDETVTPAGPDASVTDVPDTSVAPPPPPPADVSSPPPPPSEIVCQPAKAGHSIPARSAVMSKQEVQRETMLVADLYNSFSDQCGSCHIKDDDGNFKVTQGDFATLLDKDKVLGRIFSEFEETDIDTGQVGWMPPPPAVKQPASARDPATDPYLRLGEVLRAWFDQGKPADKFFPPQADPSMGQDEDPYLMTPETGNALTSLGNCVPDHLAHSDGDEALDQFFAGATELPRNLIETDLITLDARILASHSVIAYTPAYPLWSDDARKIRHVRVPNGESIRFNEDTQGFDVPPNTRFYKTFLKKVRESDGSEHYRKIETRLIVARPPTMDEAGKPVQTALFGTYEWNDTETAATLSNEAVRSKDPHKFADHLRTIVTDEETGATRHYAIPGSERCVQCHMGSPNSSFVLGMLPVQMKWHPRDVQGVIEDVGDDELTQLQRLMDYGVISGIENVDEVLPLDRSQGSREPRNVHELIAQGYMLGNCAHCHNPLGFPSQQNPELSSILNFLPGTGPNQGIFQFPLDLFSPRIGRGLGGATRIPYITPSLVDYPSQVEANLTADHESPAHSSYAAGELLVAPWRSLIYRNVDTPFPYSLDLALFPHMPMNVPGFDCRAPPIMGSWMVSIPATRVAPKILEQIVQSSVPIADDIAVSGHDVTGTDTSEQPYVEITPDSPDYAKALKVAKNRLAAYQSGQNLGFLFPQPSLGVAAPRLVPRYTYCPDTSDIRDATVTGADQGHLVPSDLRVFKKGDQLYRVPVSYDPVAGYPLQYTEDIPPKFVPTGAILVQSDEGIPDRPHWVNLDTTEEAGAWQPRRSDWDDYLVTHKKTADEEGTAWVIDYLKNVTLSGPVKSYLDQKVPFGLWIQKDACRDKLKNQRRVKDLAEPPKWVEYLRAQARDQPDLARPELTAVYSGLATPPPLKTTAELLAALDNAPVYYQTPGAFIFGMVCQNCHGPKFDSHGRQADTLQLMTGGDARVANFRDGFFGPTTAPGTNWANEIAAKKAAGVNLGGISGTDTPEDWAARYMSWMALGGTTKKIPVGILNVVSITPVLGHVRIFSGANSANMLGPIQKLCRTLVGYDFREAEKDKYLTQNFARYGKDERSWGDTPWLDVVKTVPTFIPQIADAEVFARLCSLNNPTPVRVMNVGKGYGEFRLLPREDYPANTKIGTHRGTVAGRLDDDNVLPWCVYNQDPNLKITFDDGTDLPECPLEVKNSSNFFTNEELDHRSYRGGINGGLAVYWYLSGLQKGAHQTIPPNNRCEDLTPAILGDLPVRELP